MSNLVIAIIGAAIFSAILVFGINTVGPKVEEGRVAAAASQLHSELSLVSTAVNRLRFARQLTTGADLGDISTYINAGYLERVPINPAVPGRSAFLLNEAGQALSDVVAASGDTSRFSPRYVGISLGQDQLMCTWFARYVGQLQNQAQVVSTNGQSFAAAMFGRSSNCFRSSSVAGNPASGNVAFTEYFAFVRI